MRYLFTFLACLATLCYAASAQALEVQNMRVGQHPGKTRLVLDLSTLKDFRAFTLSDPYRVVIDMPTFTWPGTPSSDKASGIQSVRHGPLSSSISRIVLDMDAPVALQSVFALPANQGKPDRLVVDFAKVSLTEFAKTRGTIFGTLEASLDEKNATAQSPRPASPAPQTTASLNTNAIPAAPEKPAAPAAPLRKPVIILDPGHGGVDPGAVSGRTHEKNITLALGRALKDELERTGKFQVYMTRNSDRFIKLYDRVKFARKHNADLFISLHADSIGNPNVRGASIYTLSEKASDAQTAKLAARENKADLIAGIDLSHEDEDVANILLDLTQRDTMNQSKFLAEKMVRAFKNNSHRTLDNPHRYAGFAVLKAPDIPSILIEAGFVSSPQDARQLSQDSYRKKLAKTISSGVELYFEHVQKAQRL
jgi:N-acetylmuramoyl-L-alanine amidase